MVVPEDQYIRCTFIGAVCSSICSATWDDMWTVRQGKGCPVALAGSILLVFAFRRLQAESPENLQATYPTQYIAMDPIPSLPKSYKGSTKLLIWVSVL